MKETNLVHVVGVGRSGTSLVQSMLNAHSAICFPPEIGFIRTYLATRKIEKVFRRQGERGVVETLVADTRISRLKLTETELRDAIRNSGPPFTSNKLYLELLNSYAGKRGTWKWLGDKDPGSIEFLITLRKYFPKAVVIHVIRDPRDVLSSKKRAAWSRGHSVLYHIFANRVQLKLGRKLGPKLFGRNYHEIFYRELLLDPAKVLTEICHLLDVEFEPAMLSFAESSKEIVAPDEMEWKKETLGPLLGANRGKWLRGLADWEIDLTEATCKEAIFALGYKLECRKSRINFPDRVYVRLVATAIAILDPCYRFYRILKQQML